MRYLMALGIAILVVAMMWPLLRRYAPRRQAGEQRPPSRGEMIYLALVITIAISFVISTMLWVLGR
jgi:heme/copper-type cytochrome/quinol oxidase subunit 2